MKRFDLVCSLDGGGMGEPEESPEGDWVRFDDVQALLANERERCAKVCDSVWDGDADTYDYSVACNECAITIRELGD